MSYHQRYRNGRRPPMGDIADTITTAIDVASDPYVPEIVCRVQQLQQIGRNQPVKILLADCQQICVLDGADRRGSRISAQQRHFAKRMARAKLGDRVVAVG